MKTTLWGRTISFLSVVVAVNALGPHLTLLQRAVVIGFLWLGIHELVGTTERKGM